MQAIPFCARKSDKPKPRSARFKILASSVSRVCNGTRHTHAGCKWKKVPIKAKK